MSKKQNLKDVAYQEIKRLIIDCVFEPNSTLNEEMLQKNLGISRTPIREALAKLENEGLIEVVPKKGIWVSGFTVSDLYQVYEIRLLTEPYVIRTYGKSISREALHLIQQRHLELLKVFRNSYTEETQKQLYQLDDDFHALLFSACNNPYLQNMRTLVDAQSHRGRIMLGKIVDPRILSTLEEHLSILQSILDGDYEQAATEMIQHLTKSQKASMSTIMKNPSQTRF